MSTKYTRLSSITIDEIKNALSSNAKWVQQSSDEMDAHIDGAIKRLCKYRNSLDLNTYAVNSISDADLMLSPTKSGIENLYVAYCKIKFDAYDAGSTNVISYVSATKVLIYPDEENYEADATDDTNIVYTIPILGATLDKTYKTLLPDQSYVYAYLSSNNLIVTVPKSHVAFDIEIEKKKES